MDDMHVKRAAEIYGIPEDQVTPEQRNYAKMIAFADNYGSAGKLPTHNVWPHSWPKEPTMTHLQDRNTVAHLALNKMLGLMGEHIDRFDVQIVLTEVEDTDAETGKPTVIHEHINKLTAEVADDDGTWGIQSFDDSHEDFLDGESLKNYYARPTQFPIKDGDPDPSGAWAAAQTGWAMIKNWVAEQKGIDGDLVQVTEILNEFMEELK